MKAAAASELQEQQALRKRLYYAAPQIKLVAVPNAARRSQWEANKARQEGLAKGFPDLAAIWPGGGIAFIEMKAKTGRVSEHQQEWLDRLIAYGFRAAVCRSADSAIAFLRECGAPVREVAA